MTGEERRLAVHADAYTPWPDTGPRCATCHQDDCPRYWRIHHRLDRDQAARRAHRPAATYQEPPW